MCDKENNAQTSLSNSVLVLRNNPAYETLGDIHLNAPKIETVSSISSIDSFNNDNQEPHTSGYNTDDLDKLSLCLSELSDVKDSKKSSLFNDVIQAQLAFWTLVISIFYSYAWQYHRKKFLFTVILMLPPVLVFCCTVSSLLTTIVVLGRVFSAPLRVEDIFKLGSGSEDDDVSVNKTCVCNSVGKNRNLNYENAYFNRQRTFSGNSHKSSVCYMYPNTRRFERKNSTIVKKLNQNGNIRSTSMEELALALPKPVCRKHSSQQTFNGGYYNPQYFSLDVNLRHAHSNNKNENNLITSLPDSPKTTSNHSSTKNLSIVPDENLLAKLNEGTKHKSWNSTPSTPQKHDESINTSEILTMSDQNFKDKSNNTSNFANISNSKNTAQTSDNSTIKYESSEDSQSTDDNLMDQSNEQTEPL